MIGRDVFGGRDSQQLYDAIRQLEDTKIELYLYDKDGKEFRSFRFNLIISSGCYRRPKTEPLLEVVPIQN